MSRKINEGPKIRTEKETVALMIELYCHKNHGAKKGLCSDCTQLQNYAQERLNYCRFGEDKTTCQKCPVHCYRADMKERIRVVMRFSGPRMMLYHPVFAVKHLVKNIRS